MSLSKCRLQVGQNYSAQENLLKNGTWGGEWGWGKTKTMVVVRIIIVIITIVRRMIVRMVTIMMTTHHPHNILVWVPHPHLHCSFVLLPNPSCIAALYVAFPCIKLFLSPYPHLYCPFVLSTNPLEMPCMHCMALDWNTIEWIMSVTRVHWCPSYIVT